MVMRKFGWMVGCGLMALVAGCSDDGTGDGTPAEMTGGTAATSTGGMTTGGAENTGGTAPVGTGGDTMTGGAQMGSGGMTPSGGMPGSGGEMMSGGTPMGSGGMTPSGGMPSSGGVMMSGGTPPGSGGMVGETGGDSATGGADAGAGGESTIGGSDTGTGGEATGGADTSTGGVGPEVNGCPTYPNPVASPNEDAGDDTWDGFAQNFFAGYCTRCHGSTSGNPPKGLVWDDPTVVHDNLSRIRTVIGMENRMPPNDPRPSCEDRWRLVRWIDLGAP